MATRKIRLITVLNAEGEPRVQRPAKPVLAKGGDAIEITNGNKAGGGDITLKFPAGQRKKFASFAPVPPPIKLAPGESTTWTLKDDLGDATDVRYTTVPTSKDSGDEGDIIIETRG